MLGIHPLPKFLYLLSSYGKTCRQTGGTTDDILPLINKKLAVDDLPQGKLCMKIGEPNRRAIGLIPLPSPGERHEVAWTHNIEPLKVIAAAEINGFSGTIRVFSDNNQVRAGMLFYKGQILGCIFSACGLDGPLLDGEACDAFLDVMFEPHNLVHAYKLEPDVVLAAGSLLYSTAVCQRTKMNEDELVIKVLAPILGNLLTGTAIINNDQGVVCSIYIRTGVIVGVYSFQKGWVENSVDSIVEQLTPVGEVDVLFNTLPVLQDSDIEHLTVRPAYIASKRSNVSKRQIYISGALVKIRRGQMLPMDRAWDTDMPKKIKQKSPAR
jgi:hypothetical protein